MEEIVDPATRRASYRKEREAALSITDKSLAEDRRPTEEEARQLSEHVERAKALHSAASFRRRLWRPIPLPMQEITSRSSNGSRREDLIVVRALEESDWAFRKQVLLFL